MESHEANIETLRINLETGVPYGLDVKHENSVYVITRYGQVVFECGDFVELADMTWAIVRFLDISKPN